MTKNDEVIVTYDQNPAVAEAVRDLNPGEDLDLEGKLTLKSKSAEGCVFTVKAWVPEGYEVDDDSEEVPGSGMVGADNAMMSPVAMMVRKKSAEIKAKTA